jgi:hypothetical protein
MVFRRDRPEAQPPSRPRSNATVGAPSPRTPNASVLAHQIQQDNVLTANLNKATVTVRTLPLLYSQPYSVPSSLCLRYWTMCAHRVVVFGGRF